MVSFKDVYYPDVGIGDYAHSLYRYMSCDASLNIGDLVCPSNITNDLALLCENNTGIIPACGIVVSKITSIWCRVLIFGSYASNIVGLVGGNKVFLDTDGTPTTTIPTTGYVQEIGYCETDEIFYADMLHARPRLKRNPFA